MRVTFVLPDLAPVAVGGLKVAYELANGLVRRGHVVNVVHFDTGVELSMLSRARRVPYRLRARGRPVWFALDERVQSSLIDARRPERLPAADALLGVGWKTIRHVASAPARAGRAYHFSMDDMTGLEGAPGEVEAAWRVPLPRILTAHWLVDRARKLLGDEADLRYMPLGVGAEHRMTRSPADRSPMRVLMHYHPAPYKSFEVGLRAVRMVRRRHPITIDFYGGFRPDFELPDWMRHHLRPRDLAPLFNDAAIFVHSSRHEGFGLPPAEAMASGCALAATANLGVLEYAVHEQNALLAPVDDADALAAAAMRLIEDDSLRLRLAHQGAAEIASYTWDRSVTALEATLAA